ncbi:MAG TPA: hypothetical protein VKQ28_14620 [Candidatus Acidoferrum sp.]|nr:hypothetical protein [Candidatus Acidoferrum sp.]
MSEQLQLGAEFAAGSTYDRWRELDARVEAALRSHLLDEKDKEILRVIASHKGAERAIRAAVIAEEARMLWGEHARRQICGAIGTFVLLFKIPIGALRMAPYGYFLIVSAKDLELAVQPLAGEFHALLRRIRALTSKSDVAKLFGQAMLKLDAEDSKEAA